MRPILLIALALYAAASVHAAQYYGISDPHMAEYEGFWTAANGAKGRVTAQVRPLSNNRYDGFILFFRARSPVTAFRLEPAAAEESGIKFTKAASIQQEGGDLMADSEATCVLKDGKLTGTFKGDLGEGTFEAARSQRKSPTLGAKPPAGAVVLFDGQPGPGWESFTWPVKDGVMEVGKGNIRAKEQLKDFRLHVEFRTPYMPLATGQARGNSGVYVQSRYEVQVLDSFGLYPLKQDDCAGIYGTQAARVNACLPPMEWQTYDITFQSEGPAITVVHNGITVIENAVLSPRRGGNNRTAGFLLLQDHGNPVQYRNIWAEPLKP